MKKIIYSAIIIITVASCAIEYYPNTYNAPLFTGMEQFEATAAVGSSGYDGQIAYSPINHFGFIASGSYTNRPESNPFNDGDNEGSETDPDFHKHLYGEMGLGFYTGLGSKGAFEIYGGLGKGRTEGYDDDWVEDYDKATYFKYFIQPEIGLTNNVFEGAIVTRLSAIDMKSDINNYQSFAVFYEPGIVLKLGYKYVKYYAQFGFSFPVAMDYEDLHYDYSFFNVSVGLNFSFGGYRDKK